MVLGILKWCIGSTAIDSISIIGNCSYEIIMESHKGTKCCKVEQIHSSEMAKSENKNKGGNGNSMNWSSQF